MNKAPRRPPAAPSGGTGKVRIIGGRWRGTRLSVPEVAGLRPTSDRVRETLFNWLMPMLPGARVLDLFAGSGALGLEALSRGASAAVLVERDPALAAALRATAARLPGGDAATIAQADAVAWLASQATGTFDLAFVDPPFAAGLWDAVLPGVARVVKPGGWLYVEAPHEAAFDLSVDWLPHREGRTRDVRYGLYRRGASATATLPAAPASPDSGAHA
ncbi:16S rRNA (guanine(966)-N(2))-methyltransferase RsmD [Lysobacter changpingensis]|uniref:16S rRNA (guanine(966)-N(2))-methyltransferase RsmD n=1 Tax=Lysobacter changpingensis TaxID=2792784 RepID=UPI001A8EB206|nr:16S rRNA (guanine(966)-N(2))-methyltransferase RsmD [Lysobacter changpingensis]